MVVKLGVGLKSHLPRILAIIGLFLLLQINFFAVHHNGQSRRKSVEVEGKSVITSNTSVYLSDGAGRTTSDKVKTIRLDTLMATGNQADSTHCTWANLKRKLAKKVPKIHDIRIAFIGDSRVRDLYTFLQRLIEGQIVVWPASAKPIHHDLVFYHQLRNITMNFYWRPFPDQNTSQLVRHFTETTSPPDLVIYSIGTHHVWTLGQNGLTRFTDALTSLAKEFQKLSAKSTVIWIPLLPMKRGHPKTSKWMSPIGVRYGKRLTAIADDYGIRLWTAAYETAVKYLDHFRDAVHFDPNLLKLVTCQLVNAIVP